MRNSEAGRRFVHVVADAQKVSDLATIVTRTTTRATPFIVSVHLIESEQKGEHEVQCEADWPHAIVMVRDPLDAPVAPADEIAKVFGLTPAEARLAEALSGGATIAEAADGLGIRVNTARNQLSAIFRKTDTNRQGELVRLLRPLSAPQSPRPK